ncbi:hypothetical protein M0813_14170 [Anaeramoeba flamelloides]|uniref:ARG and Rhodanese-Phosphatase-superfamily-associated domain-containing protein n=1 Tax=Anaeramoeba flamelloides TaxID=1746091 RepID=A0ABQ8Z711_9EUKA|nr:hypothetical protein M0813_14170 [Anaeramoeba flamelloides]
MKQIIIFLTLILLFRYSLSSTIDYEQSKFTGPHQMKNLQYYLVYGQKNEDKEDPKIMVLTEAVDKGLILISEIGSVNYVEIENLSDHYSIYIQSGDIIKGGKQDRTILNDHYITPKSGKVKIKCFCVESGRYAKRGKESKKYFTSSQDLVNNNEIMISLRIDQDQHAVWEGVNKVQSELNNVFKSNLKAEESETSLLLTLENTKLNDLTEEYISSYQEKNDNTEETINTVKLDDQNIIGIIFVVDNKVISADIYGSPLVFKKMYRKVLKSAIKQAITLQKQDVDQAEELTLQSIKQILNSPTKKNISEELLNNIKFNIYENDSYYVFESLHSENGKPLHINYLLK